MAKNRIAAQLRKEVDQARGPAAGTVIRFVATSLSSHECDTRRYTYAAVFINNLWYVTGARGFLGTNSFTHPQFVAGVLAHHSVESIEVATEFETV